MHARIDMSSPEWLGLNDEERYERIDPVCAEFTSKFGELREVNCIGHSPDAIHVETSLPQGESIEQLPVEFQGVPVHQRGVREAMDRFLATWRTILERIAGWSPEQIAEFAHDRHPHFRSGWFLHDAPLRFVVGELYPPELDRFSIRSPLQAKYDIEDAICVGIAQDADKWHPDLDPHYDWAAARRRVEAVIESLKSR